MTESFPTSGTLLDRLKDLHNTDAWERFHRQYWPKIEEWGHTQGRKLGLQPAELEDVLGSVAQQLCQALPQFIYRPDRGNFRGWLQTVVRNAALNEYRRKRNRIEKEGISGGSQHQQIIAQQSDSDAGEAFDRLFDDLSEEFDRRLKTIRGDFDEKTWKAFVLKVFEEQKARDIAVQLGYCSGDASADELKKGEAAVYSAVRRVRNRLREELQPPSET